MEKRICRGIVAGLTLILAACAHKGAPQGGPEDKTAPRVEWTSPAADSLFVPRNTVIRARFSKWINPRNADKSVFLSPSLPRMKISLSGRTLSIRPLALLLDSATYVVTLSTDLSDFNANKLPGSHTFAFSTGAHLDSCALSGLVMGEDGRKLPSFTVGAFLMEDTAIPDPVKAPPLYLTVTGPDGAYRFSGLKIGRYRVIAWSDANQNRLFNPGREQLGLAHADFFLAAEKPFVKDIAIVPFFQDTHSLFIKKAAALAGGRLNLFFSKPLKEDVAADLSGRLRVFSQDSTAPAETLQIASILRDPLDSLRFHAALSKVVHGRKYRVEARALTASDGAVLDTARRGMPFLGNGRPDSIAPEITACRPLRNTRDIETGDSVRLFFSEPVREKEALEGFALFRVVVKSDTADSLVRSDTSYQAVSGKTACPLPLELAFRPDSLMYDALYEWRLDPKKCVDASGNFSPDSLLCGRFATLKEAGTGVLSGRVCAGTAGRARIILLTISGRKITEIAPDKNGHYSLPGLAEGAYKLLSYEDMNGNGRLDRGTLSPFRFSERAAVLTDSVFVRERWEAEVPETPCGDGKESR